MPKKYCVPSTFCKFLRFARWNTFGVDYNSSPSRTANSHTVSFSPFYVSYCAHLWLISPFRVCITVFVYYTHDHHNPHQHLLEEEEKFFPFSPDLYWVAGVHSADWVHFQGIVFAPWILIIFIAPDPDFFCAVHTGRGRGKRQDEGEIPLSSSLTALRVWDGISRVVHSNQNTNINPWPCLFLRPLS